MSGGHWSVVHSDDGAHVLPCDDGHAIACGHEPRIDCPVCQPIPVRDGPLDDPVWSHQQSDWPGANPPRLNA